MEMVYKIKNSRMFIIVFLRKVMNNIFCIVHSTQVFRYFSK